MKSDTLQSSSEVGLVEEKTFSFSGTFKLSSGATLDGFELKYESYGKLNAAKDNAIYVCHALTGDHHVAGFYHEEDKLSLIHI